MVFKASLIILLPATIVCLLNTKANIPKITLKMDIERSESDCRLTSKPKPSSINHLLTNRKYILLNFSDYKTEQNTNNTSLIIIPSNQKSLANLTALSRFTREDYDDAWFDKTFKDAGDYEEDVAFGLGVTGDVLNVVGGLCSLSPDPISQAVGGLFSAAAAVFGAFSDLFNKEAERKKKEAEEKFQKALATIRENRSKTLEKIDATISEFAEDLKELDDTMTMLTKKYGNLALVVKNVTRHLTVLLQNAAQKLEAMMVFMEYRDKRLDLKILERRLNRLAIYTSHKSNQSIDNALIAREDVVYECKVRRPGSVLQFIYDRVFSGEMIPSLLPTIVNYTDYQYTAFEDWKRIILGDGTRALLYQEICHQLAPKKIPDFVRKADKKRYLKKLYEIRDQVLYYEEQAIKKALHHETKNLTQRLIDELKGATVCKSGTFTSRRAEKIHAFLKKEYNIGPWLVIISPENPNKNLTEVYKSSANPDDHTNHTCQYHFYMENVCGLNVQAVLHVVRFSGTFQIQNAEKIQNILNREIEQADSDVAFKTFQDVTKQHGETILYINTTEEDWESSKAQRKDTNATNWWSSKQTPKVTVDSSGPCTHLFSINQNDFGKENGGTTGIGFVADKMYFTYYSDSLKMRFGFGVSQTAVLGQKDVALPVVDEVLARGWMRI